MYLIFWGYKKLIKNLNTPSIFYCLIIFFSYKPIMVMDIIFIYLAKHFNSKFQLCWISPSPLLSFEFVHLRWLLGKRQSSHQTQKLNKQTCPYQGLVNVRFFYFFYKSLQKKHKKMQFYLFQTLVSDNKIKPYLIIIDAYFVNFFCHGFSVLNILLLVE